MTDSPRPSSQSAAIPADDPKRNFVLVRPDDPNLPHTGLVGDTYEAAQKAFQAKAQALAPKYRTELLKP